MPACEHCPFSSQNLVNLSCGPGEAVVSFAESGALDYAYRSELNPKQDAGFGSISRMDMETYLPEIAEALNECEGPWTGEVTRKRFGGLVTLVETQVLCPVVERFNLLDSENFKQYRDRTLEGL